MKVGDLVRHEMYAASVAPSIVCATDDGMIKIIDPTHGVFWDFNKYYEVISEGR